ncbi:MAG: O-sialoglycoprotein endopeptidase [Firmicutes bacterium]|nr:O-sialoglycoprotein endopeptidase [Bacillota bacterium]
MTNFFLGLDSSAYTTSVAVVDDNKKLVCDYRKVLKVKKGKRGLRQQEAVFQHIKNFPLLFDELSKKIDLSLIKSVAVSTKPRNIENSYMPVFKVSESIGRVFSNSRKIPFLEYSHQDGHIASGYFDSNIKGSRILLIHISGGTTELLLITKKNSGYNIEIIGGTKDISAGQLIDRIGVKIGALFPCGKKLDEISKMGNIMKKIPVSTKKEWINFSGAETYFLRLLESKDYSHKDISRSVFHLITLSLANIIKYSIKKYDIEDVMIVGGVAANSYLRENLKKHIQGGNVYFPKKEFCTDNAIGLAYLSYLNNHER